MKRDGQGCYIWNESTGMKRERSNMVYLYIELLSTVQSRSLLSF